MTHCSTLHTHSATDRADGPLLPPKSVATLLGLTPRALEAWRQRGDGPAFIRISKRCVRYRREDVEAWLSTRVKQQTS